MSARLALIGGEEFSEGFEVDEQTALVTATPCGAWEVRGRGAVTLIGGDRKPRRFTAGERVTL